jgi:uncharacterized phiE125 gp8 family phage protein
MTTLRRVGGPAASPVSVPEFKAHMRIDTDDEDLLAQTYIDAAVSYLDGWEGVLGRCLEPQTWEMRLSAFPSGDICIPLGPVTAIESVEYTDADGAPATVDEETLILRADRLEAKVENPDGWPTGTDVVITFTAGLGTPPAVKAAVLLLAGSYYTYREAVHTTGGGGGQATPLPMGVDMLIAPFRRMHA